MPKLSKTGHMERLLELERLIQRNPEGVTVAFASQALGIPLRTARRRLDLLESLGRLMWLDPKPRVVLGRLPRKAVLR